MNTQKRNILLVTGFFPYPPTHGGMVDVWNRVLGLKKLGYQLDILYTSKNDPEKAHLTKGKEYFENIYAVSRKNKIWHLCKRKPLQVTSRKGLKEIKIHQHYTCILLEGDYVGYVLENKTIDYNHLIIRSHNNEARYFHYLSKSTRHIFKKLFFKLESTKFAKYSNELYTKANRIWFISKKEKEIFQKKHKNDKGTWLPAPFAISEMKKRPLNTKNVLFIGSLFMENNLQAILWYLENVHPFVQKEIKNYRLIIAGSLGNSNKNTLQKIFNQYNNLDYFFDHENLDELYEKSALFINPMHYGAGVKIKSINAIVNGVPLLSTSVGAEGTGLQPEISFLLANTKEEFIEKAIKNLSKVTDLQKIIEKAQDNLLKNHYFKVLKNELSDFDEDL